ncbi:MAG: BtpA/SgcQ family protein [Pseudomonadota bacterium]
MTTERTLLGRTKPIIGMVHVGALPGTPRAAADLRTLAVQAAAEARDLARGGVDAVMIENMHDLPYLRREVGPEIVAAMTAVGLAVREAMDLPLGVQILAGANRAALAVAQACGASFIRAEGFAYAHVADEGLMDAADAGPLLRYRRAMGADTIAVWADVKKKHSSHAITGDLDVGEVAAGTQFMGASAVIVTGNATGHAASVDDLAAARAACTLPVVLGSGATPDNLAALWPHLDAVIVGSDLKLGGDWRQPVELARVQRFIEAVNRLRCADAGIPGATADAT